MLLQEKYTPTATQRFRSSLTKPLLIGRPSIGDCQTHSRPTLQPKHAKQEKPRPIAFIVEPRDEVYARLASDIVEAGYRVVRGLSVTDAINAYSKYEPRLVVAHLSLPSQAAWRMAPELAMLDSDIRVWLYDSEVAVHDYAMADFLAIEQLIEYGGDLFHLSTQIRRFLGSARLKQTDKTRRNVA